MWGIKGRKDRNLKESSEKGSPRVKSFADAKMAAV